MPRPKGKMHAVTVTASKDGAGDVQFRAGSELWDHSEGHLAFHKERHAMRKHDFHLVEFVLNDETGEDLRFPHSPHDAMWVAKAGDPANSTCPGPDTAHDYSIIEPLGVSDDGQRLIVRNDNPAEEHWAFTLNLVPGGKQQATAADYVSWDPIIKNGNGGAE